MTDPEEMEGVLRLLEQFENAHAWPTRWIQKALKQEWRLQD